MIGIIRILKIHSVTIGSWRIKTFFHTLQMVATNKKMFKINKAFLRIIAIIRFMKDNAAGIKTGRISIKTIVVRYIQKVAAAIGVKETLKYLSLNFSAICKT